MKDKEKQIEEMAKDLEEVETDVGHILVNETFSYVKEHKKYNPKKDFSNAHTKTFEELTAEEMYNLGYRKLPDSSVVLSKEEYEVLKVKEKERHWLETCMSVWKNGKIDGSKETAEKIIKRLKQIIKKALKSNYNAIEKREEKHPYLLEDELFEVRCKGKIDALTGIDYELDELAKSLGVEIKEN